MIVKTKSPINFQQWVDQASRFTRGDDNLIVRNIPENTLTSGIAEIRVRIEQPLYLGFKGIVTYLQHFTKDVLVDEFDGNGDLTGNKISETISHTLEVIKYNRVIPANIADPIFQQAETMIDQSLVGFEKDKAVIIQAILNDVVFHGTFGGLTADDYETFTE